MSVLAWGRPPEQLSSDGLGLRVFFSLLGLGFRVFEAQGFRV